MTAAGSIAHSGGTTVPVSQYVHRAVCTPSRLFSNSATVITAIPAHQSRLVIVLGIAHLHGHASTHVGGSVWSIFPGIG
jgi:hypothetical protein